MKTIVAGVGMTAFQKTGTGSTYDRLAMEAIRSALVDAGVSYSQVEQAYAGYVYGDSTSGQHVLYGSGMTGIPIINVNNNCSTGSTALFLAHQAVSRGAAECVLAVGFEQMDAGALKEHFSDRPSPTEKFCEIARETTGRDDLPFALNLFAGAGISHMRKYGTKLSTFAKIRAKASRHAAHNPLAIFRSEVSEQDVLASKEILPGIMTRLMACPPSSGAAAAILVSESFARRNGISCAVSIAAQSMVTDTPATFDGRDMINVVGSAIARVASNQVYERAGVGPEEVDVVELHDCFAHNELLSYESLGLCAEGEGERFVVDGDNTYGGKVVTNPSGGLLSKGHPLGATGLAQCFELTQQLRGASGARQVAGARLGLQHNLGIGGACVVTLYERN